MNVNDFRAKAYGVGNVKGKKDNAADSAENIKAKDTKITTFLLFGQ